MRTRMVAAPNFKRIVLVGAFTAVTIAGTLYGAGLKTEQEMSEVWQ